MKEILKRLKSPVVIAQLISVIGTIIVIFVPGYTKQVKELVVAITTVVNIFAGLNNPTDKKNF